MFEIFWASVIMVGSTIVVDNIHYNRPSCEASIQQFAQTHDWKILQPANLGCIPVTVDDKQGASNQIDAMKKVFNFQYESRGN